MTEDEFAATVNSHLGNVARSARREGFTAGWTAAIQEAYDLGWIHDAARDEMMERNPNR